MFKKILFPTDDSIYSKNAMKFVEDLAGKYGSEVIVLHTYFIPETFNGKESSDFPYLEKAENNLINNGKNILNKVKVDLEEKNIKVKTILEKGSVGPTIVSKAETEACDLIVMGSRGISKLTSLLISSNCNYTIHHAKCPVLMVH